MKHSWIFLLIATAVAWLWWKRKEPQSVDGSQPVAAINAPAASVTPDYLSYNLPAWQKPELLLPTASVVSPMAGTGSELSPLQVVRPIAVSAASLPSAASLDGCCESSCGCAMGGNLAASADQLLSQYPDLAGNMASNLLSAFPNAALNYGN